MAQVEVTINGHAYKVACDDGEEQHLQNLADYVDRKVAELTNTIGQVGESRLMLMAGLVIADELAETMDKLEAAQTGQSSAGEAEATSVALGMVAQRIEDIAAELEKT